MSKPTPDQQGAQIARARTFIAGLQFPLTFTIDDYPIGRKERGRCRLSVERHPRRGSRTKRETTEIHAANLWRKPKFSTYHNARPCWLAVVTGCEEAALRRDHHCALRTDLPMKHDCGWLYLDRYKCVVIHANGATSPVADSGFFCPPRVEDRKYDGVTTCVLRRDSDEALESWQVWASAWKDLAADVTERMGVLDEAVGLAVQL